MGDAPVKKKRGCLGMLAKLGCGSGVLLAGTGLVGMIGLGLMYRQYVIVDPGEHVAPDHIRSIIAQESPVYYRDGVTRVGVFFEDEHRQYVSFDELPLPWVMGIVAAEDGTYWSHPGVSAKHIVRAMRDNLKAGSVVAGGSTLSQQTAKNLYYRPDRSLKAKGEELLNALRLEYHYDKRQILTWYANQFHVSGNGRGLGIGARHFFDKDPGELEVEEAAFLSGLVKGPANYDPFYGSNERREKNRKRAHDRTRYVLGRLVAEDLDHLVPPRGDGETEAQYDARVMEAGRIRARAQKLLDEGFELNFKRGTFRYDSSAVLDEVARRLQEAPFSDVLAAAGIEDPARAGLKVVTTLDPAAQNSATYGLWHHLTEVGTWMEKYTPADFAVDGRVPYDPDRAIRKHEFRKGTVKAHIDAPKKHLEIDIGGQTCTVDRDGVVRVAVATERGRVGNRHERASTKTANKVVESLPVGTKVWVSVREAPGNGPILCDLEKRPVLQGAVMVVENGEIRAMIGGNDNRNFNRTTALRQMGSTWKPLVFHAAMQLGWTASDELDNRRNVFPYSTTFYYPRPDHDPADVVSMSWAGVNSENLASVWLLYHLTDRLDSKQVAELATSLDLAQRPDEDDKTYATRIQKLGVLPTRSRVKESLFLRARHEVWRDMKNARHPEDVLALESLYFGWGFESEQQRVVRAGGRARATKTEALKNSWTHLSQRVDSCERQYEMLELALRRGALPNPLLVKDLSVMVAEDGIEVACGLIPEGFGPVGSTLEDVVPAAPTPPQPAVRGRGLGRLRDVIRGATNVRSLGRAEPALVPFDDVRVEERLHVSTLRSLEAAYARERATRDLAGSAAPGLYEPDVLYWHQDFRVLLSIRYLEQLARTYGVASEIDPVMSLPLGANDITLEEVAMVYSGITSGESWAFPGEGPGGAPLESPPAPALLIAEIRDVDDNVLYRAKPESTRIAKEHTAEMTADILRNIVRHGTGRRAASAVNSGGTPVPLGGKTGTTNDFRNAAFAGYAPRSTDKGYVVDGGFVVASYVGYDDNREMKNGSIRLAGSSGALPAWIGTIDGMAEAGLLGDAPVGQATVGGAWAMAPAGEMVRVAAAEGTGTLIEGAAYSPDAPSILVPLPTLEPVETVRFRHRDRPIRISPRTDRTKPRGPASLWGRRKRNDDPNR